MPIGSGSGDRVIVGLRWGRIATEEVWRGGRIRYIDSLTRRSWMGDGGSTILGILVSGSSRACLTDGLLKDDPLDVLSFSSGSEYQPV
jgi:hypothetical protein